MCQKPEAYSQRDHEIPHECRDTAASVGVAGWGVKSIELTAAYIFISEPPIIAYLVKFSHCFVIKLAIQIIFALLFMPYLLFRAFLLLKCKYSLIIWIIKNLTHFDRSK